MMIRPTTVLLLFLSALAGGCDSRPQRVVLGVAVNVHDHPAVELAVREINRSGGINGVPLELDGLDWQVPVRFPPSEILEWVERFEGNHDLLAVIGHTDSTSTLTSAALYNRKRIPQIVTIATHPAVTRMGEWIYRMCVTDDVQGLALARYAVQDWGKSDIAVFYVNDDYGKGLAQAFHNEAERLGARIVSSTFHDHALIGAELERIGAVLERLRREDRPPDLFVLFQRTRAAVLTAAEIRRLGFEAGILCSDSVSHPSVLRSDTDAIEGMRLSQFLTSSADDPGTQEFFRKHRELTGRDPGYSESFAYDAVYLFRDAVAGGGFSREGVKRHLDRLVRSGESVQGVSGEFRFGTDRDAVRSFHIVEIRDRRFRPIASIGIEAGKPDNGGS
jgi:branched-chain amino acid transport system substrate-binding protein